MNNRNCSPQTHDDLVSRSALLNQQYQVTVYDEGGWAMRVPVVGADDIENAVGIDLVRCKDCSQLMEYNETRKCKVQGAIGDCFIRTMHIDCDQFIAVAADDYCSYASRRKNNDAECRSDKSG